MKDISGDKFGRWTAIRIAEKRPNRDSGTRIFWECKCECGNVRNIDGAALKSGHSKSCGCLRKEGRRTLPHGVPERNTMMRIYKRNAEDRGLSFSLTTEQFTELIGQDCFYCGAKPEKKARAGFITEYACNGIDRVRNNEGYSLYNCVACCKTCNKAKMSMSEDDFAEWVVRVYKKFAANKMFWNNIYADFQPEGYSK